MSGDGRTKAALFYEYPPEDGAVFGLGRRERIEGLVDLYPTIITGANFDQHASALADVEVIFATWGIPRFDDHHFAVMPNLKAVFYAAGNVKSFAAPLIERNVLLVGAWDINAIPVAEMCLSQVLLSLRGYFRATRNYAEIKTHEAKNFPRSGVFGETVGLIGLGKIGTRLRNLLEAFPVKVIAHDPFLTDQRAAELNVERVSLDEIFERSLVVSNHIPDLESTVGVLNRSHFDKMREGATFINSGRGAQVVESDLISVLEARSDLTALLDVTLPEPPSSDSPLWSLLNVVISPHIGGTVGDEVVRMADCMIEEFELWRSGKPLNYEITAEVLATMG
ncbi:MAG: hydroxyacid dehydrogenase [Chloroflexi bacterium]|jgi:phosphoglycerate dehydrogenase-like enzyme|nr:hydroxyacid dehydrogenase [Chloroflexota bacterium]